MPISKIPGVGLDTGSSGVAPGNLSTGAPSWNGSGAVTCLSTISVGNATPATTGAGVTFPATQSASSNANTLDDYEEGTWTPNISSNNGAGTFVTKVGSYVKIGRQVTIWFVVDGGSSLAAGTTQYLGGLPFSIGSIQTTTILGQMGTNGPTIRTQQLMTLSGNRDVMYVYIGGSQETTSITFAGGCATYWVD